MKVKRKIKKILKNILPHRIIYLSKKIKNDIGLEKRKQINHFKNKEILKSNEHYENSKVCAFPFSFVEIHPDGSVRPCCAYWNIVGPFGNYFYSTFEKIWNSDRAQRMRKTCWTGEYDYCNLDLCFPDFVSKENFKSNYNNEKGTYTLYPKHVKFCLDLTCNVNCIMCRDEIITNNKKQTDRLDSFIKPLFLPMLKDAELVILDGIGELFVSKYCIKLIKEIIKKYPKIKFGINSNGILCNEKNCINIFGNIEKIYDVSFSIHAATKETYNKIVKNGNFDKCMENVEWLSLQKKLGVLKGVTIGFCVSSLNYHEMKIFLQKAISHDINASFWLYQPWGASIDKKYKDYSVWDVNHSNYKDFEKLLKDPIFNDSHCGMNSVLRNIQKQN
jgi:uncharacterized Fe-S cluster-containing radical SAM superfamily protein